MKRNILVTGGAGFIGSFIVDELVKKGNNVTILDNLEPQVHQGKTPDYLNKKAKFVNGTVLNRNLVSSLVKDAEIIYHEASMVGVGQSMYQIAKYMEANTQGTALMMDILVNEKHNVKKFIVAASMSSYGEGLYECPSCGLVKPPLRPESQMKKGIWEPLCPNCGKQLKALPTSEDTRQDANSIYALSKKNQEETALMIGKTYGIPTIALRYFNVYGPRQSLSNPYTGVAAIFLSRLKNNNPPTVYEDGLQTRDFISVHDVVQANTLAMEKKSADYETFNVGAGDPKTIVSIAETLAKLLGKKIKPNVTKQFRKGDVRHCYADISKIKKLGYKPKVSFEEGMKELIEWSAKTEAVDKFDQAADELKKKGLI
ncbi:MAG: NAD-dependent epimerase/dehydratase family protein [Nanoarchaeota archaeon]|nr:MAG: NAD-dependent epimerase/dehydratase family protein [Nanoarchaeota archaeon]